MSLRHRAVAGVGWSGIASVLTAGLGFLQLAVLAHLLSPGDFGLMAMALVVLGFAHAFADMGMSNAVIHRQDIRDEQLSSLYWVNVLAGFAACAVLVIASPLIAMGFREPRLTALIASAAMVFLIVPFGQLYQMLLQKQLDFKALGAIEVSAAVAGTAVAIACAVAGQGVYSLVWGLVAESAAKAALFLLNGLRSWRPALRLRRADLDGFISFGLYQMGERSINYFNSRIEQLLIGSLLGAHILGFYNLAVQLVMQPLWRINPMVMRVAFPVFSRVQSDAALLSRGYFFVLRMLSVGNFPLLIGLAVVSPWLVPLCFGDEWRPAIPIIQVLSLVALLRTIANPIGALLLAKGRADWGFKWNLALLLTQLAAVIVGVYLGGVMGVVWALLAAQAAYTVAGYRVLVRGLLGPCLADYLMTIIPAFTLSLAMATAVALSMNFIGQPSVAGLISVIGTGIACYSGFCLIFQRRHILEIGALIRGSNASL